MKVDTVGIDGQRENSSGDSKDVKREKEASWMKAGKQSFPDGGEHANYSLCSCLRKEGCAVSRGGLSFAREAPIRALGLACSHWPRNDSKFLPRVK